MGRFENTTNENLFIALCALRWDRACSTETFVDAVQEADDRLKKAEDTLDRISKVIDEFDQGGISNDEAYWCKKLIAARDNND